MMKTVFLLLIAIVLSGCYEKDKTTYHFNWAVVDKEAVENEVFKRANIKNPYPEEISMDREILNKELRKLSTQVNQTHYRLRNKCSIGKKNKEQLDKIISSAGSALTIEPIGAGGKKLYNEDCLAGIKSDSLLNGLKAKKEKLNEIYDKQSDHSKKIREFSKRYTQALIDDYAKSKFEVVVGDTGRDILYNPSGLVLNITDALISQIDDNQLIMPAEM